MRKKSSCNWKSDSMRTYGTCVVKVSELSFAPACSHECTGLECDTEWIGKDLAILNGISTTLKAHAAAPLQ